MEKRCIKCNELIFNGRADKKFCNNNCRMSYHNNLERSQEHKKLMSDRVIRYYKSRKKNDPILHILWRCRDSAIKKGFEYNLDYNDIHIPKFCPLLGIELSYDSIWSTPSIDRIDSSRGYIKDNVWIISRKANHMKQDVSIELLKAFAKNVLQKL